MSIIKKETSLGTLYYSNITFKYLLEHNGNVIKEEIEIEKLFLENRVPLRVQFEITEKCNFSCYYCYAEPLRGQEDLKLEDIKKIIDKLDEMGIVFLELTGGEVLSRNDFLDILKYINTKKFIVSIFTNASQLNDEIIKEIKNGNINHIRTSLLAPNEEMCDELTGIKGSFKSIINGINLLKESNIKFSINSPLTNPNIGMLNEYRELEEELNIKIDTSINLCATFDGYEKVKKYSLDRSNIGQLQNFFPSLVGCKDLYINNICSALKSKFAIDCSGNVLPCMKYRKKIGNLLFDDIIDIWNSNLALSTYKEIYEISDDCQNCDIKRYCKYCPGIILYYKNKSDYCLNADLIKNMCESVVNYAE